ncbi:MAG: Gfo/Idh/MocA family oxidoreductase [Thermoplasmatota archaeon]
MGPRVGVVGVGTMGRNHVRVLRELGALACVVDADMSQAKTVADAAGVSAMTIDKVIGDASVDALVIATPTATHKALAVQALEAGKHVLVEKPIAFDPAEGEAMIQAARKAGRTLAVGHIERFNPAVRLAKETLARGELGHLITLTARRVSNLPGRIRDVGCILDLGIHDLDTMRYLVGQDPVAVHAEAATYTPGVAFEDHAVIVLEFPQGIFGLVEVNWLTPMKVRRLSLTGSEAFAEVDYMSQTVKISTSRFEGLNEGNLFQAPLELSERVVTLRRQEPLRLELEDFLHAATTGKAPLVSGADGLAVLRIARAAVEAAKTRSIRKL